MVVEPWAVACSGGAIVASGGGGILYRVSVEGSGQGGGGPALGGGTVVQQDGGGAASAVGGRWPGLEGEEPLGEGRRQQRRRWPRAEGRHRRVARREKRGVTPWGGPIKFLSCTETPVVSVTRNRGDDFSYQISTFSNYIFLAKLCI
jgi:hypothetical protein